MSSSPTTTEPRFLPTSRLNSLFDALHAEGWTIVGPTVDQEAIIYDELHSADDLPRGWTDEQSAGRYRLVPRDDEAYFGYVVGPHSWKKYLFPARLTVSTSTRDSNGWSFETPPSEPKRLAFLGVRACELAAIAVQDRVFLDGPFVDDDYAARRDATLLIAVNCGQAAETCFCTSMETGPRCRSGFDLALTETSEGFVIESGSTKGDALLAQLPTDACTPDQAEQPEQVTDEAARQISKRLDRDGLRDLLLGNLDHPQWDDVASRCLSCTNCTMVCPTCFCMSVEEVSDLSGDRIERVRQWDSCFNPGFSDMSGGPVRTGIRSRYRQWLTHKLASWEDQFGTSGCVGCGRCITWCPAEIDLTQEVAEIRRTTT